LSMDEITHLRQTIASEVNAGKDAIVAPVEQSQPVVNVVQVTPVTKYVTPDGKELKPVEDVAQDTQTSQVDTTPTVEPTK